MIGSRTYFNSGPLQFVRIFPLLRHRSLRINTLRCDLHDSKRRGHPLANKTQPLHPRSVLRARHFGLGSFPTWQGVGAHDPQTYLTQASCFANTGFLTLFLKRVRVPYLGVHRRMLTAPETPGPTSRSNIIGPGNHRGDRGNGALKFCA